MCHEKRSLLTSFLPLSRPLPVLRTAACKYPRCCSGCLRTILPPWEPYSIMPLLNMNSCASHQVSKIAHDSGKAPLPVSEMSRHRVQYSQAKSKNPSRPYQLAAHFSCQSTLPCSQKSIYLPPYSLPATTARNPSFLRFSKPPLPSRSMGSVEFLLSPECVPSNIIAHNFVLMPPESEKGRKSKRYKSRIRVIKHRRRKSAMKVMIFLSKRI